LNNFGILRDAETIEWKRLCPVFDTGNSLWNESPTTFIYKETNGKCKHFRNEFHKQLRYILDYSWLNFEKIKKLPDYINSKLKTATTSLPASCGENKYTDERVNKICEGFLSRIKFLEYYINSYDI
jgi:hypothetical protein